MFPVKQFSLEKLNLTVPGARGLSVQLMGWEGRNLPTINVHLCLASVCEQQMGTVHSPCSVARREHVFWMILGSNLRRGTGKSGHPWDVSTKAYLGVRDGERVFKVTFLPQLPLLVSGSS